MMKNKPYLLLVYLFAILSISPSCFAKSCDAPIEVTISAATRLKQKGVGLRWKIHNRGNQPVFVYSTFLDRRQALTWERREDGTLGIYTFLPGKLRMTAYSFPKAAFTKLEPNKNMEGVFEDTRPTVAVHKSEKIVLLVAYGPNVDQLQKDLEEYSHSGDGHPANPIVDWQCVATSNVTQVQ